MNTESIINDIKKQMTGDPHKDGPFLRQQSEKYKNEENSEEINRELAKLLYECSYDNMNKTVKNYLAAVNPLVDAKIRNVNKKFKNNNIKGGLDILKGIIKDNLFAWADTDEVTYKSFGTPIEHALYLHIYQPEKEIRPISCNLSEVYALYGFGLTLKEEYSQAIDAFKKALELNPTDPEIYLRYCELLKKTRQTDELRENINRLMYCSVTKEQLGKGYFNYSFYFAETEEFEKASAMLEMSRIFLGENQAIKTEQEFIAYRTGMKELPTHTQEQLMAIMTAERIQPGPSALVISTANFLAKHAQTELDYKMAKYYYETVWELTELDEVKDQIEELDQIINDLKENKI